MFATEVKLHFLNQQIDLVLRTKKSRHVSVNCYSVSRCTQQELAAFCYINMFVVPPFDVFSCYRPQTKLREGNPFTGFLSVSYAVRWACR